MGEEIAFENGRSSDFQGLVTLTLTWDRVILHHSSNSTYIPNFTEIEETFCGRMDGRTFETHFIMSTHWSRHNKLGKEEASTHKSAKIRAGNVFVTLDF